MEFVVGQDHWGTPESAWATSTALKDLPPLGDIRARRLVVVAPHPDDEVFGAAGLVQTMGAHHMEVVVVAVTDGEASHPQAVAEQGIDLRSVRRAESTLAFDRLGVHPAAVTRLGIPDGHVADHVDPLIARLSHLLLPDDVCVAPWWSDGHPDHDACGEAARVAARSVGARSLGYLVWAWHWAHPDQAHLPWADCRRLDFTRRMAARKRWATGAFHSQTRPLGADHNGGPLLPALLLRRFWRPYEVFVDVSGVRS
jgi:LmbE family N-acetylglucosaminyl deacetylase